MSWKRKTTGPRSTAEHPLPRSVARLFPTPGASADPLSRWIVPALLIGAVAGLGAVALFGLLHLGTELLLENIAGFRPYRTSAEGGFRELVPSERPWAVPLVAAGGALLATAFAVWLAPEARGHGTDSAIAAAHHDPSGMRGRTTVVKLVASALTLGSGGSGGTEGPAAQISAAFGSVIARRTGMSRRQARTALVIGLASGVGAIFQAPLGGALLGAELLYRREMDARVLPKALLAACSGWLVFGACYGFAPVLGRHSADGLGFGAGDFVLIAVTGLLCGLAGRLYTGAFYAVHLRTEDRVRSVPARIAAPAAAALLVGVLGLLVPGVLGTGYGLMEALTDRELVAELPVLMLLAIPLAKIAGTALTVGSGGSGGIFGPCMVVGAGTGALAWRLGEALHLPSAGPLPYVVVGMAACLGPVANAPLGVLVMATEMVADASLLGPGMLAVLCASAVTGRTTLYRSQLERRPRETAEEQDEATESRSGTAHTPNPVPTAARTPVREPGPPPEPKPAPLATGGATVTAAGSAADPTADPVAGPAVPPAAQPSPSAPACAPD
ncbi:chloride channel protein [Streptomyces sp. CB02400]|uniref:chloride channel protein n=1 Tax=Streptomyces sp. CB02400 TaxID=1703944 RepID=UPI0009A0AC06|nr:chloride channel protein [Streptomyces sp. CB02400]